jgi:hypothetical protein
VIPAEWAVSTALTHPALVGEADFVAVQQIRAARVNDDGVVRRYLLAGLIRCRLCGRLMDAHWVNGRAGYRCRHGNNSVRPAPPGFPRAGPGTSTSARTSCSSSSPRASRSTGKPALHGRRE